MTVQFDSQYQGNICHKLNLDQYYTPRDLAVRCASIVKERLGTYITEYFETSAGDGAFVEALKKIHRSIPLTAVDIEPKRNGIIRCDFLTYPLRYKKGRCFIGNPPFGARMNLTLKFWKKCIQYGDYIAWILPISQYKSVSKLYEFDMIYSEDIGEVTFSGCMPVRCCFNIYRRPLNGLNKSGNVSMWDVSFMRSDSKAYADFDYDFRIVCWGGRTGQLLKEYEPDLSMVYKIKVNNPNVRKKVYDILSSADWKRIRPSVSSKKLCKVNIVQVLREGGLQ